MLQARAQDVSTLASVVQTISAENDQLFIQGQPKGATCDYLINGLKVI